MSYCVNCGVELDKSEPRCPLCGTRVVNPADPDERAGEPRPYPSRVERISVRVNRRYTALLVSLLLLIPVFVCIFTDLMTGGGVSWSAYVTGAMILLFAWLLLPFLLKKPNPYGCILFDGLAALAFLLLVELITEKSWFLRLGLPLTVLATAYALLGTWLCRPECKLEPFIKLAVALSGAGFVCVGVECILGLYQNALTWPHWSGYVLFPCLVLSLGLFILNKREKFKSELKRRFYV